VIGPTGGAELAGGEDARARRLLDAQAKAAELFQALEDRGLIGPGCGSRPPATRSVTWPRARQIGGFYEELLDLGHTPGARTR
jgi:hypothetical protein